MNKQANGPKKPYVSLSKNILITAFAFIVFLCFVLSFVIYRIYTTAMFDRYEKQLTAVADYVEIHIDKDDMSECAKTYVESETYKKFQAFLDEMIDNYNDVHYIYIMQILGPEEKAPVVEICTGNSTYEKENDPDMVLHLGDAEEGWYDAETTEEFRQILRGDKDVFAENPSEWGIDYTLFRPLIDSSGEHFALLCVDISIDDLNASIYRNIFISVLAVSVCGILFLIILMTWMNSNVTEPIRSLERSVTDYANKTAGSKDPDDLIYNAPYFDINNEVSALGDSVTKLSENMRNYLKEILLQQDRNDEQLSILASMAKIYDYVNLIDFSASTEMLLNTDELHKIDIAPGQDHTHLVQGLRDSIDVNMVDEFWNFTNISTVPTRLVGRNSISGEFVSNKIGWFRAQYIRINGDISEKPSVVIYTVQSIDADKRREEKLILISRTDELTRLFNRRCCEEDIDAIRQEGIKDDLVIISADLNGLKNTNDNLGHMAGDELIRAAASCLTLGIEHNGKIYRTGGDEFIAIVYCDDVVPILERIRELARDWRGNLINEVSISLGYASHKDHPDATIEELEKLADEAMYKEKEKYYQQPTHNRRSDRR